MHAEGRIGIGRIGVAVHAAYPGPVGVQLLGQDHGQAGLHALAEIQPVDGDCHRAVARDLDEGAGLLVGLEGVLGAGAHGKGAEREAGRGGHLQEAAAAGLHAGQTVHGVALGDGGQRGRQREGAGGKVHGGILRPAWWPHP